ncbi:Axotactin [Strongyloides ratti]|uniref:Axotactin n=1 Tax=Strongyloides ratti TaxID=34506 RepID=A0A090MXQ7_STRRB|nr:Axotactin [Strongyloides ratti]CEF65854.1 Axotactin [Strongyloides ratti]
MYIKLLLYLLLLTNLSYSLNDDNGEDPQIDTCFLLSSKTSKITFEPIIVESKLKNYIFYLIIQKNSTGEVGVISINQLSENNKQIWYNTSIIRSENEIVIEYSSNISLTKIKLPANQTNDIRLFIELDLLNKYFSGYTYSNNNEKIHEVNVKLKSLNINNNLSNIYVSLGSLDNFGNGFIGEVDFKYIKIDGKKYFLPNNKIFSGDIAIEEKCTQLDDIKDKKSLIGICTYSEKKQCLNGGMCQINKNGDPECLCPNNDYTGKYCQFALVPKTCSYIPSSGIHKIDVDGSDIGEMGYVKCDNGTTIISHNFPPNTIIRNKNITQNLSYDISYKLMSYIQIRNLIQRSQKCQQMVTYSCYGNAPLYFKEGYTSFESIYYGGLKPFYKLNDNNEFQCNCKKNNECLKTNVNCNCDINDNEIKNDTGVFVNRMNVGIRKINVFNIPSINDIQRGLGLLNISDLSCYGDIGYENDFTLSFTTKNSILLFYRPIARRIEFEFRLTTSKDNFNIIEINDKEIFINLFISNNKFIFNIKNRTKIIEEKMLNYSKVIGDTSWNHVILELNRHELRISIDDSYIIISNTDIIQKVEQLFGKNLEFKLENFIGCIRALYVDDILVNLSQELLLSNNEGIYVGCRLMCQKDTCLHGSKCIENIKENTYECKCKDDNIYYGDHCQFSINQNTDISFTNPYESYIGYDSKKSLKNISSIYQNITMSFKTDQRKALLIYAMDEVNNFIQIHLSDEYRIILSMNYGNISKQCTVYSDKGTHFNNMEWKQIQLKHFKNNVTLFVDNQSCSIIGSPLLTKTYVVLDEADDEIVIPPILPGQINILPYKVLYVGGVPRAKESGDLITWSTIYNTKLPSILGCIRGLKFSSKFLDLRFSDLKSSNKEAVKMKCQYSSCDLINCQNKGYCSVKWFQQDPKETFCDCSKTSFYGPTCEDDDTIKFSKFDQQFSFDMTKIRRRYDLFDSKTQSFKFAFSTDMDESTKLKNQVLSLIQMDDETENIEILLETNKKITININNQKIQFNNNFTDGYRHFIQMLFDQRKHKIWLIVDDDKKLINQSIISYNLAKVKKFIFGYSGLDDKNIGYNGYISNIDINYHKSNHFHFMPLKYYKDPGDEYYDCINVKPNNNSTLLINYKSSFKVTEKPLINKNSGELDFPIWDVPLKVSLIKESLNISTLTDEQKDEDGFNYTILIIAIIIIFIILLIFIIIGLCVSVNKGHQRKSVPILKNLKNSPTKSTYVPIGEQLSPLNDTTISYYPNKDDYTLPEPQIDPDPIEQIPPIENHPYFYSTSTQLYFTPQESLTSNMELMKQDSEENNDDDDPLIKLTDYEEGRNSMIYIN